MRGDILLFPSKPGDIQGKIIDFVTAGGFSHVEVQVDDKHSIGEIRMGLNEHPIPLDRKPWTVSLKHFFPKADIEKGMKWVADQELAALAKQRDYGFKDLVNDAFKFLHLPLHLPEEDNEWDCSHFVTLYLMQMGIAGELSKDPSTVSPNDIARYFHVLAPHTESSSKYR